MKHLIICREFPPVSGGGIGTYVAHIARLLAESEELVHVIGGLKEGGEQKVAEECDGRLIIHRVPMRDWMAFLRDDPPRALRSAKLSDVFGSGFHYQCFSWQASLLAERLVEREGIDVIEAQEFEAPLYYLQLRRALGLGPKQHPPCIVHLHSPMEFIVRYNDWDMGHPYFLTAKRFEDYSIAAADALLCPSRYLARQAEAHYGLAEGSIQVIPLPIGDSPLLERDEDTWEHGTICYTGRLEKRKGVLEWIEAAVRIAREYPTAVFEFIGGNVLGTDRIRGEKLVERLIPDDLRGRFRFHGQQPRSALPQFLKKARLAVVPSRWENFPYTCVEAMGSGLPVIASHSGGMVEMIEDGHTGWLARKAGSEGLVEALKCALDTSPVRIAEMGRAAALAIRAMCDNKKIVEGHLEFRGRVGHRGVRYSCSLPANLPWAKRPFSDTVAHRFAANNSINGVAIVVTCCDSGRWLSECLQSLAQQIQKPAAVVVVDDGSTEERTLNALSQARREGWEVIRKVYGGPVSAKNAGIDAVLNAGLNPLGFAFLDAGDRLSSSFVAACKSVLQRCPQVGIVSGWFHYVGPENRIWLNPCPSFPYQWWSNDAAPFSAIRTEALVEAGRFRAAMDQGYEDWDLVNAVMAAGWVAVTVPEMLGRTRFREDSLPYLTSAHADGRMRQELLARFPGLVAGEARDIIFLAASHAAQALRQEAFLRFQPPALGPLLRRYVGKKRLQRKLKNALRPYVPAWVRTFVRRGTQPTP
jgi:glycogen synthase